MATYYVEAGHGGTDSGTEENPWLTITQAMDAVGAGDKVWVKASADYTEIATIITVGTDAAPIVFEGYTSSTGDGGQVTINGGASRANCIIDDIAADTKIYYVFKNFRMTNATGVGFLTDCNHITFKNCKFDTHGGNGLECRLVMCEDCDFESNGDHGVEVTAGGGTFIGCTTRSNTNSGIYANLVLVVALYCTFYDNGNSGIQGGNTDTFLVVANCTIDGNNKNTNTGVSANANSALVAVINTVVYDCTTGISNPQVDVGERAISRNNCVNSNTADYGNMETFTGEVTDAPNFVDEVDGADYTPDTDSPLIDAGFDAGS